MEASVLKLSMAFTDEVRRLENLVNLWRGEAKLNADTLDLLRRESKQKDAEILRLGSIKFAYDELCISRDRAWSLLAGGGYLGETWTKALCDEVEKLRKGLDALGAIRKLGYPLWDKQADWGHPIVP